VFGLGSLAERAEAPAEVVRSAEEREQARSSGDFARADALRAEIEQLGWEVRDRPGGFDLVPRQ
jgi:cysteinyl-tRNA synthetase